MSGHHSHGGASRALVFSLALVLSFAAIQFVASWITGSLALFADAGHTLVDSAGLALALIAGLLARRPPDSLRSFGYARVEVLVVPLHVLLMLGIAGYIAWEAFGRMGAEQSINALPVLFVAVGGLAVNLFALRLLHAHSHGSLNTRGAFLEVLVDAFASVGVIISAVVLMTTGWTGIDILVALVIAALIVPRALRLGWQSIAILLETAPGSVSVESIRRDAETIDGVAGVHDLHVWSVAPHFTALSAHLEVRDMRDAARQLAAFSRLLRERHGIAHVTLQPETRELHEAVQCCAFPDAAGVQASAHDIKCEPRDV